MNMLSTTRLRAALQTTLVLGIIFAIISIYISVRDKTIEEFNDQQMLLVQKTAESIQATFQLYEKQLGFLARQSEIIESTPRGREMLASFFNDFSADITSVTRMGPDGTILDTHPLANSSVGKSIAHQGHVQQLLQEQQPVLSDVFPAVQGFSAMAFHVPVFRDGNFDGSIAILMDYRQFVKNYIHDLSFTDETRAWMLTEQGTELYCGVEEHIGHNISETDSEIELARRMLAGGAGSWIYTVDRRSFQRPVTVRRQAVYAAISLPGDTFWSLAIAAPELEILSTIAQFRLRMFSLMIALLGLTLYFFYTSFRAWALLREEVARREGERALQKSEEKFRSYIENATDGIFVADAQGRYVEVNPAACRLTGYSEAELLSLTTRDMIPEHGLERGKEHFKRVVEEGISQGDMPFIRKDGTEGIWTVDAVKLSEDRYLGFARDITERMKTRRQLESTVKEKEVLLTEIHHRTKNNMAVIMGLVNMQGYGETSEEVKAALDTFKNRIMAMSLVHEQLYQGDSFSEIDAERYLGSLYNNLYDSMAPPGLQITFKLDVDVEKLSLNQAIPLGFVVNEILTNSFKHGFIDKQQGAIDISFIASSERRVKLIISDDGEGFNFSEKLGAGGSIGLNLIKLIVEDQLGGEMEVDGQSGTGYRIEFNMLS